MNNYMLWRLKMHDKLMLIGKEPSAFLTVIFGIERISRLLRRPGLIVEFDFNSRHERR
jgi:hypothetical protein